MYTGHRTEQNEKWSYLIIVVRDDKALSSILVPYDDMATDS